MEENDLSKVESQEVPNLAPEILPLPDAIHALAPGCAWSLEGFEYKGLKWQDRPELKPSESAVMAKARELKAEKTMYLLRKERDQRLREVDWVTLRAVRTGEEIPQEWKDYMQALADITKTAKPFINGNRVGGVDWPARPDGVVPDPYRTGYRGI